MTIDECIDQYIDISKEVFTRKRKLPIHIGGTGKTGNVAAKFDSKALEDAVKTLLKNKSLDPQELLKAPSNVSCKVYIRLLICSHDED